MLYIFGQICPLLTSSPKPKSHFNKMSNFPVWRPSSSSDNQSTSSGKSSTTSGDSQRSGKEGDYALEKASNFPRNQEKSFITSMKQTFVRGDCRLVNYFILLTFSLLLSLC